MGSGQSQSESGFAEAATVLDDNRAITREDPDRGGEERFVTLG